MKIRDSLSEPNLKWFRRVNVVLEPLPQPMIDSKALLATKKLYGKLDTNKNPSLPILVL